MPDAGSHTGTPPVPRVLPRSQHNLSRSLIDPDAVKVMYRLVRHGYKAYLVGGSVRDLLLGRIPKDFDVATDARPAEIRRLFRNCRLIGRRFRIVHVFFRDNKIIEVSTFRRNPEDGGQEDGETEDLARKGDNAFGEPHEDAFRRDFTINGLFYDISTFSILDYVGRIDDLRIGVIRTIGDPDERFREDPVRMLRAVRHAARTGFYLERSTYEALLRHARLIETANPSRLQDELQKDLAGGALKNVFRLHKETGLMGAYFPELASYLEQAPKPQSLFRPSWVWEALSRLDASVEDPGLAPLLCTMSLIFPLLEADLLETHSSLSASPGQGPEVHESLRRLAQPLGVRRRDQERLSRTWTSFVRLMAFLESGKPVPLRFVKRPHFQEVLQFFRFYQAALGVPDGEIDQKVSAILSAGRSPGARPPGAPRRRRRRRRRPVDSRKEFDG